MKLRTLVLLFFLLVCVVSGFSQDSRLVSIKRIYIVPNGDEGETRQFEEKIPKQLGWLVTYDKAQADAFLYYYLASSEAIVASVPPSNTGGLVWATPVMFKTVEIWSVAQPQELLWRKQSRLRAKIAGRAVDELKRVLAKVKR